MSIPQLFATAVQHHRGGRLREAESLYRQILQTHPNHADALHLLGVLAHQTGRQPLAIEMISLAIKQNAQLPAYYNNLGNAYVAAGMWRDAETSYRRALERKRDYPDAYYNLGSALRAQGKLEEAAASYRDALRLRPNHAETHLNLGNILQAQGKLDEAAEVCQRAIALQPDLAAAHNNLGNIHLAQNRFEAALAAYARALQLKPDLAEAHHNHGLALLNGGRSEEAVASCKRALSYKPDYVAACVTLGHALTQGGHAEEATRSYDRAIALDPDCGEALLGRVITTIPIIAETGAGAEVFADRLETLVSWASAHPGKLGEAIGRVQPFYLPYRPVDVTATLCRYGELASAEATAYWKPAVAASRKAGRIRLVVVSGQIRQRHPVWDIILRGLIARIDPREFEVFLFHTGATVDEETAWARAQVPHFVQGPKPVKGWLAAIAEARPDAIFYPEVGMDPSSCTLAALRLAPLQIAGWGHPVTTGLPSIDWFLSGELLEGPDADQHYREKLLRLPGTGVHTEFSAARTEPWGGPERGKDLIRFALPHQPLKFDPRDDILLARIAKAAGAAEFWLATPGNMPWTGVRLRGRLATAFRAEGLDPEAYLRTMPWMPRGKFLGFLDEMDIYLDCPAFSGYTTAWQALHCGLPIITLEGPYLRQRLAAGLLRQVGMPDGVTASREQYVATAVSWANECREGNRWAARRDALRRAAPRADGNGSAVLAFEQKLREAFPIL